MNNIISFEEFEKAVMNKIMEEDTSINAILRKQYKKSYVESRDFTGVGFFTDFKIPKGTPFIHEKVEYAHGNVEAVINGIDGFGFILFIKDGVMSSLEGYTWRESWPEAINSYQLFHEGEQS